MSKGYVGASNFVKDRTIIWVEDSGTQYGGGTTPYQAQEGFSVDAAADSLRRDGYNVVGFQVGRHYESVPTEPVNFDQPNHRQYPYPTRDEAITSSSDGGWLYTLALVILGFIGLCALFFVIRWAVVTSAAIRGIAL